MDYTFALIIHVLCAIIFLGFVFCDVVVLPVIKKTLGDDEYQKIIKIIISRGVKVYPPAVLLLILSGGYMFTKYINSDLGFLNTNLQILLALKVFLVLLIVLIVLISLFNRFTKKEGHAILNKHGHLIVLILGFFIVILGKLMFVI